MAVSLWFWMRMSYGTISCGMITYTCPFLNTSPTNPWWRHQMETFSALLAICAGNSPVTGELPAQRPVTRSFDVFFDLRLNKRLSKQSWCWWFETLSRPLWRHCNALLVKQNKSIWRRQTAWYSSNPLECLILLPRLSHAIVKLCTRPSGRKNICIYHSGNRIY